MEEEILYSIKIQGVDVGIKNLEDLTKANKALRDERKLLNLSTEEGQKRLKEINDSIDKNTNTIKENSSAIEKQRLNIGNYSGALDKLVPGLGATANGFTAMKTSAMAFIATPIGAVIGALGLVIATLTQYFRDNEEGQNRFNKIMNIGSAIVGKFTDLLSFLGENVFKVLISGFETTIGFLEKWVPGFANATKAVEKFLNLDRANYISDLEAETDALERQLIVRKAQLEAIVAEQKLRAEDKSLSLKDRKKALDEASKAQKELNDLELKFAENKLKIIQAQNAQSNSNKDALKAEAEATAALDRVRKDSADKQKEIFTKNQDLRNQEIAKLNELSNARFADEIAAVTSEQKKQEEYRKTVQELTNLVSKVDEYNQIVDLSSELAEQEKIDNEEKVQAEKDYQKEIAKTIKKDEEIAKRKEELKKQEVSSAIALSAAIIGLNERETAAGKFLGLTTILTNAGIGVSNAIKAGSGIPFPGNLAAILTGVTAVLTGITQAKGLLGFAQGGLTGTKIMSHHGLPINRSNGDNRLATVRTGEVILNERQQAALGGAKTFARIGVPGFAEGGFVSSTARASENNINSILNAFSQVPIVVTVEDINAGFTRVNSVVNRARVIG